MRRIAMFVAATAMAATGVIAAVPAQADVSVCVSQASLSVLGQQVIDQHPGCIAVPVPAPAPLPGA